MKATESQVGGNHYKDMPFQPVELFAKTKCTAFQANIWKYITRYKNKNGAQDIKKCIHYAQLAMELKCNGNLGCRKMRTVQTFCSVNKLSEEQKAVVVMAGFDEYKIVIKYCQALLLKEYPHEV